MPLSPEASLAVETSLEVAGERCPDLAPLVYARLFAAHPDMKALFWRDTSGAIKGEMLAKVFEAILDFIGERRYAARLIQCEVVTHEGYDVPRDVFGTFFDVVAETVRGVLGADWTDEIDGAWRTLLGELDFYVRNSDQSQTA